MARSKPVVAAGPFGAATAVLPAPGFAKPPLAAAWLRVIISKTAGREDYGAQLGDVAATTVVEVHKRKAGPGHGILQERDRRCLRQAMLTAQMQNGADKAMAAGPRCCPMPLSYLIAVTVHTRVL